MQTTVSEDFQPEGELFRVEVDGHLDVAPAFSLCVTFPTVILRLIFRSRREKGGVVTFAARQMRHEPYLRAF